MTQVFQSPAFDGACANAALAAATFDSVRGPMRFNVNQYPIHDIYMRVVAKDAEGRITNRTIAKVTEAFADPYAAQCKMPAL